MMKLNLYCIPSFQCQILQALRFVSYDEWLQAQVLWKSIRKLLELPWDSTPSEMVNKLHKVVRGLIKVRDLYAEVKRDSKLASISKKENGMK